MANNNNRPIKNKNESIKYKQENNNAIPFFNQGMKLFDNIKQKITQEFSRGKREGYENGGILGPNTGMRNKIAGDNLITDSQVNAIGNNLAQYSSGRDELTEKTSEYLNIPNLNERNYNLFMNELPNPDARELTKCVKKTTLNSLSDTGFLAAYPASSANNNPSNFQDFSKAKEACKTWAVDSNKPIFALTRDANSMYNCHVGSNNQSAAPIYTKPDLAYNLDGAESTDANSGGLFANGLIGVYKNLSLNTIVIGDIIQQIRSKGAHNIHRRNDDNIWKTHGWGRGMPTNINPWWIWSDSNFYHNGHSEYLYYFYNNPNSQMNAKIYICADDSVKTELNGVEGVMDTGGPVTKSFNITLKNGLNIFKFRLLNTGGPGGLLVAVTPANSTTPLFISDAGDRNWGVSSTSYSYASFNNDTKLNTENIKYFGGYNHNTNGALSKYIKCDKFIGGDINTQSITASFGRNCSNIQVKPLTARYVKVKMMTNTNQSWLQISQLAIWGYENGKLTNLAYKCRTNQPGTMMCKSIWYNYRATGTDVHAGIPYLNSIIDGKLKVRNFGNGGYHSGHFKNGEGHNYDFVLFDLGASYPITKIVYYNRGDCCQFRAKEMQINLYTTQPPISGINQTNDGGLLSPPIILTGDAVQEFNVKSNNTGGGEVDVDCSSHTEITPSMPAACRDKLLADTNTYKIVGSNNGTVNCNTYCRGTGGNSWNNEMPDWKGAKCVAGGNNYNKACSFRQGSHTKCICKREDSLGWA